MTPFDGVRVLIFLLVSVPIVHVSWHSLQDRHSYGFYRFFAFEILLIMVLLNLPFWFKSPFSITQMISWVLLIGSALLAVHGFSLLRRMGQSIDSLEQTTQLIETGAFRFIRHPLYASLLYFAWGVFFKSLSVTNAILTGAASLALLMTAMHEEQENLEQFGEAYRDMMARTRRFIPFVF